VAIVVGIDGSAGSTEALRWAIAEAQLRNTAIDAVYAWSFPRLGVSYTWAPPFDEPTLESMQAAAFDALGRTIDEVENPHGIEIRPRVVEGPAGAILVEVSEGADLLVVGSRGLGGFKELLLGSVGHQCAQHARCPVVIIHQPKSN